MTVTVKKQFEELYALLNDNANKKVSAIMPQIVELMSRKGGGMANGKNFLTDAEGKVTHVYCYYHKMWEDVTIAEYGSKKGTATGLNTMCKEGVSAWTKQQRRKKQAESNLLAQLAEGVLKPEDIGKEQARILEESKAIEPRSDEHGFSDLAELSE